MPILIKKLSRIDKWGRKLSKFVEKVVKMPKNGSSAYEMSNFTSLLFHRSTLSLVRAHMERLGGSFHMGRLGREGGPIWGGSGGGGRGVRDPKTQKNRKKVKKSRKNRFFDHFFWFLAVFGRNLGKIWEKWSKMVKKGVKNGQKQPKNRGF